LVGSAIEVLEKESGEGWEREEWFVEDGCLSSKENYELASI
jgi:hypothetical protein